MHPLDLAEERERRRRREHRKLATAIRHAIHAATPAERVDLIALSDAVRLNHVSVEDARQTVAALRRTQQTRNAA